MEITFNKPTEILIISERKISVEKITIVEVVDNPSRKIVWATTKEVGKVILWKDADYDAIGQWTDSNVSNRVIELYGQ